MESKNPLRLETPRSEKLARTLTIGGISRTYPFERTGGIPDQWQSFTSIINQTSRDERPTTFGVIYNGTDISFDYISGVEITNDMEYLNNLEQLELAPQNYLVFSHKGHVTALRETCDAIWQDWLPSSDHSIVEAPWFERYGKSFNSQTGDGGLEIWIPVAH